MWNSYRCSARCSVAYSVQVDVGKSLNKSLSLSLGDNLLQIALGMCHFQFEIFFENCHPPQIGNLSTQKWPLFSSDNRASLWSCVGAKSHFSHKPLQPCELVKLVGVLWWWHSTSSTNSSRVPFKRGIDTPAMK